MNERYDVDWTGREDGGGTALDVRSLLEEASWPGHEELLDPHEHWASGRRRRRRKRAGAGVLGGVALVAMAGLVWQAGVFGGEAEPLQPHVATLPSGLTTFVLAAPGADAGVEEDGAELAVPDADDLAGTSWALTGQVWGSDESAAEVVGADADTVFSFAGPGERGWGFTADDCGVGWFQEDLRLTADGAFAGGVPVSTDLGCPEPAQTAEDFWGEVLARGGTLHTLDQDWLLLSVDTTRAGVGQPSPGVVDETDPPAPDDGTGTAAPPTGEAPTAPPTATPPAAAPTAPTAPTTPSPSKDSPAPSAPASPPPGTANPPAPPSVPDTGPAFMDPEHPWIVEPWPASGGGLYAPGVRAGVHDGFDRVVMDLTGEPGSAGPGWYAAYTADPVRDGSGLPMAIAGDAVLEIVLNGMAYPEPGDPVYDDGDVGLDTHRLGAVEEVIRTTPFEGQIQLFVGMRGEPRPYRVFLLQDPLRLVVDVQTS